MTLWMAWTALFTALVALAALTLEYSAARARLPRRGLWIVAMATAVAIPVLVATRVRPPVVLPTATEVVAETNLASTAPAIDAHDTPVVVAPVSPSRNWRTLIAAVDAAVAPLWAGASALWCGLLLRAVLRLHKRRRTWRVVQSESESVLVSIEDGPAVIGFVHPRIVIPRWALFADRKTRELLLLHEREHLRAHDSRVLFGAAVLLAAFPWNAALWWMSRRLRLAIEIDCDARVIRASGEAHSYGTMLVTVGERYAAPPLPASAFLSEPGTHLEARIDAMTTPRARRPMMAALPFAGAASIVVATAAWTPLPAPFRAAPPQARAEQPKPVLPPRVVHDLAVAPPRVVPPKIVRSNAEIPRVVMPMAQAPKVVAPKIDSVVRLTDPRPLRGNPAPRYPDEMRSSNTEGHVLARVKTDARGIPDSSSMQIIEATSEAFANAVRATLPRWRFDSEGTARIATRFTLARPDGSAPFAAPDHYTIDGIDIYGIVIVTAIPLPPRPQDTPARRQFDAFLSAFNNSNPTVFETFGRQFARDPDKSVPALAEFRGETGGFDLVSVRRGQQRNLEFVVRSRAWPYNDYVGYFGLYAEGLGIESLRILRVQSGRSVDDPALIEYLQAMPDYPKKP